MISNPHPEYAELSTAGIINNPQINQKLNLPITGTNYTLVAVSPENSSGYLGYAWKNDFSGEIVVVHEGSENITNLFSNTDEWVKDWIENDGAFTTNEIPPQYTAAKNFLDYNKQSYSSSDSNVIQIGQSLGGGLAQLLGMLDSNKNIQTYTYNAPGCYRYKDILTDDISSNFNNISNYRSRKEPVSGFFKQAGNTFVAINGQIGNHDVSIQTDSNLRYVKDIESDCYPYGIITSSIPKSYISNFNEAKQTEPLRVDPLLIDLDGDGIETTTVENGTYFDHQDDGFAENTAWVGEDDGVLVYDKDSSGTIDNGNEIFGDNYIKADGTIATSGFDGLSDFDSNNDGVVNSNDEHFLDLKVLKGDGTLLTLAEAGIASINLNNSATNTIDTNGNAQTHVGSFIKTDGTTGQIADYLLANNKVNSIATDWVAVSEEIEALPDIAGSGTLYSLHQAMARNTNLKQLVSDFSAATTPAARRSILTNILISWAGAESVESTSRGESINAKELYILEKFMGELCRYRRNCKP